MGEGEGGGDLWDYFTASLLREERWGEEARAGETNRASKLLTQDTGKIARKVEE